ncbi:threonine/serine exporter ThrE family protein [uncultured Corynebacterium sp.]|uniref:threonine/serine exporter ThrE n=1 Tax=uncultured Corynebacterium sp. TaxID=159447 RepID=UPI0025E8A259|nr:threonine/serine exporter family protein [uncultured Corynebacterium sp.]
MRGSRTSLATVDVAKAAPPPSPLAPVDLTNEAEVTAVMEIAARIGGILISAGTSNADTRAQVYLAAASYGLHYCHVDVLTNTITIHTTIGTGAKRQSLHVFRVAPGISVNFSKLSAVDKLIRSIHSGSTPPAMAERILDEIDKMPPPRGTLATMLGWGVMGGAFAVMLGGGLWSALLTFVIAVIIMSVNAGLERLRVPLFYQNIVGGFIAVVPAAILYNVAAQFSISFRPSQVIGSGIIVLVAGLTLVQALVDGITRAAVTSSARFFEAMMATAAIVAGVGSGIQAAEYSGFPLPPLETLASPVYHQVPLLILVGSVGSAAFAYASWASWTEVIISGLTAAAGMVFYYFVIIPFGVGAIIACFASAIVVGLAGGLLARRYWIPPLITMIIGYTPMLPGLTFYRSMYAIINEQMITGLTNLFTALTIAGALAAGVLLGERGARRLRRPQHFRPYAAFKRLGRASYHQAARIAASTRRIPRVPLAPLQPPPAAPGAPTALFVPDAPSAPGAEAASAAPAGGPVEPPIPGPAAPAPVQQVRAKQYATINKQFAAMEDALEGDDVLDVMDMLEALDPATETWEAITDPTHPPTSSAHRLGESE